MKENALFMHGRFRMGCKGICMTPTGDLKKLMEELEKGIALAKCRQCGCMKGALEEIRGRLKAGAGPEAEALKRKAEEWLGKTEESLYT